MPIEKYIFNKNLPRITFFVISFLVIFFYASNSQAATEFVSVIRENCAGYSDCYTSLASWEAVRNRNLVDADAIEVARIEGTWTSPDTTAVVINDWTTDAAHYIKIYTTSEARHSGIWNTGKYRLETTNSDSIQILENYTIIDGLQIKISGTFAISGIYFNSTSGNQISNSIVSVDGTVLGGINFSSSFGINKIWNNIVYVNNTASQKGINLHGSTAVNYLYNNTIVGNFTVASIYTSWGTTIAKNNLIQGSLVDGFNNTFNSLSDYNISSLANDAPGVNSKNSTIASFMNSANKDFRLSPLDAGARDFGVNLSSDANLAFFDDIDGTTRPQGSSWDIGADETSPGAQPTYQCSDTIDNDSDGLTDYPEDSGCSSTTDNDEYNAPITTDTTPPIRSNGLPTGSLSSGTTSVTLSVNTNENSTCRYSINANTPFASIANTFSTTGGLSHSQSITNLQNSQTYNYYVRCQDAVGNANTNDYPISFSVSSPTAGTSLTQCGYLDQANTTYVLQNDVSSNGTCFTIIAQNVVLDLNGKTMTYDNSAPIAIPNNDFEYGGATADSWNFTNAPNAQRTAGTLVQPQTVFSGTYAVKIPIPASDQFIKSTNQITLEPNTTYSLSAMVHSTVAGSYSIYVGLEGSAIQASAIGQTWYFQFIRTTFTTGAEPVSYNIVAGISGATGASAGNVYIDDIQIQRYRTAGVAVGPQSWAPLRVPDINRYGNAKNAVIKNGSIIQGTDRGDDSRAIVSEEGINNSGLEIANLNITVSGPNSKAIYLNNGDNMNVHDNVINSAVDVIRSRHQRDGALIKFEYDGGGSLIHHNTITSGIQNGIIAGTKSGAVLNQIYQNNITLQTKYTNDFAIAGRGLIYDNTINCGSGNNSCRGIFGNSDSKIYNNIIDVQQLSRNQEYDGCQTGGAYGIQIEYASNTEVYNNTVTARADQCSSAAFRNNPTSEETATLGDVGVNNYVHDNTFTAIRTGNTSNVAAQGIRISNLNRADSLRFENNTVTTNSQWLQATSGVSLVQFKSNTFKTITPMPSLFLPFYTYDWNPPAGILKDIKFIDNKYLDLETENLFKNASIICNYATSGISLTGCAVGGTNPADKYSSFYYSWTLSINVKDGASASIPNAAITISDTLGNTVFSGVTDSSGVASVVLDEFKNTSGAKTFSNPHTITISKSGFNSYSGQITMDSSKDITVNLETGSVQLADTTPPAISNISSSTTTSSATIAFSTSESSDTQVQYGLTTSYGQTTTLDANLAISHSQTISGLTPNTTYNYRVITKDSSGNTSTSLNYTFATQAVPDSTPPSTISNLSLSSISQSSIILSFTVPTDASGISGYDIRYSASLITNSNFNVATQISNPPTPSSQGTTQQYTLVGLASDTVYYFAIKSRDPLNNTSNISNTPQAATLSAPSTQSQTPSDQSGTVSVSLSGGGFTIYQVSDSTPPSTPSNAKASPSNTQISLSWINPNDLDFVRVKIIRKTGSQPTSPTDGALIYEGNQTVFTDTNLSNNQIYYYAIYAYDNVPNYSTPQILSATPLASLTQISAIAQTTQTPTPSSIQEGSLIRGPDGIKVYIVNAHNYKRHIFNPEVFNMYGHFKWNEIKEVDQQTMDSYQSSDLYRADTDTKVFSLKELDEKKGLAQKRWFNLTGDAFIQKGYNFNQVFIINTKERDFYQEGTPISETESTNYPSGSLIKSSSSPDIYLVISNKKIKIKDQETLLNWNYSFSQVQEVNPENLNQFQDLNIPSYLVRAKEDTKIYRIISNQKLWIKTTRMFLDSGYLSHSETEISPEDLNLFPDVKYIKLKNSSQVYELKNNKKYLLKDSSKIPDQDIKIVTEAERAGW